MNSHRRNCEVQLNDDEVLFPEKDRYEDKTKEELIATLKDRDCLIERLWFELKSTREQEQLWREYATSIETKE